MNLALISLYDTLLVLRTNSNIATHRTMTLDLYPTALLEGDLTPSFGPEIDEICQAINDATKGFGTNEKYVPRVLV